MKSFITFFAVAFSFYYVNSCYSQSNTPCTGAPVLPIGAGCAYTNGTTVGASYQNDANNGGTPTCAAPGSPDAWYSFVAPTGGTITAALAAGSITDSGMALYSGTCPGPFTQIACDDDSGPGLMSQITASGLTPGVTYYIRVWRFGSASGTGTFQICLTAPAPPASNTTCALPSPICSGSPISFVANAGGIAASTINPGNNYTCLFTSPNPSWYYLEIATAGNLVIDITAGSDIDYSIWGPFSTLANAVSSCNTYGIPQDCSYSPSAIEQAIVPGVSIGQVYVLLVTNFANTVQTININQAASNTATTNCAIVPLPVGYSDWDANMVNGEVRLTWTTESEVNSDYFAIQRSANGTTWETISVLNAQGNSSTAHSYSHIDKKPKDGTNYYRIMQVDNDANFTYTSILAVNSNPITKLTVFPNPAKTTFFVGDGKNTFESAYITDVVGKRFNLSVSATEKGINVDCENVENGMYTLTAVDKNGLEHNQQLIINH